MAPFCSTATKAPPIRFQHSPHTSWWWVAIACWLARWFAGWLGVAGRLAGWPLGAWAGKCSVGGVAVIDSHEGLLEGRWGHATPPCTIPSKTATRHGLSVRGKTYFALSKP